MPYYETFLLLGSYGSLSGWCPVHCKYDIQPMSYAVQHNKQICHTFLFNVRNYLPKVINIQRRVAELNIILPRVNNFNIKQTKAWTICFIVCHQYQTRCGKLKANKTVNFGHNTRFFCKNWSTAYLITTPNN